MLQSEHIIFSFFPFSSCTSSIFRTGRSHHRGTTSEEGRPVRFALGDRAGYDIRKLNQSRFSRLASQRLLSTVNKRKQIAHLKESMS